MSGVTTTAIRDGVVASEGFALDAVPAVAAEPGTTVWVDVSLPDGAQSLSELGAALGISEIAIEDALSRHERPKVDRHDGYLFVNTYAVTVAPGTAALTTAEISVVVLPTVLLTVRGAGSLDTAALAERWNDQRHLLRHGPAALLYGLLDLVVDGHFATVQALDDEAEAIEDLLFDERSHRQAQERTYRLRKSLVLFRRHVLPMREVVNTMLRRDIDVLDPGLHPYYQDLYDHVLRVAEWSESLRDVVATIFETGLSLQDHRLNVVIKKLTSWAAIIAVPTAITGFFGQNVRFPGEASWSGMALSLLLITASAVGLFALFRRHDWL